MSDKEMVQGLILDLLMLVVIVVCVHYQIWEVVAFSGGIFFFLTLTLHFKRFR